MTTVLFLLYPWLTLVLMGIFGMVTSRPDHHIIKDHKLPHDQKTQLLYIMIDGFRWDYVDKQSPEDLPGFTRFLREGGRARWTTPLFPSISYPTWTTLVTGRYAESHGIVGNFFYDDKDKDVFQLFNREATGKPKWWTSEPIWTTAEKAGLRTAQFLWSRCDVPINGITTTFCESFVKIPGIAIFQQNINRAIDKLTEGFDMVQVYTEHTDYVGHSKGPNGPEIIQAVRELDEVILNLLNDLRNKNLHHKVNIIIVSDHGMMSTDSNDIETHEIDEYIVDKSIVENMADGGAYMNINVPDMNNVEKVFVNVSKIPGVKAYKKKDIPLEYHYQNSQYIHEIILSSDKGHYIMPSKSDKQLPRRSDPFQIAKGNHGYRPDVVEMRGIFFAKGPAFKNGWTLDAIHVVDVYQVLTHVLGIQPQPHNGTWGHVQEALAMHGSASAPTPKLAFSLFLGPLLVAIWRAIGV